MGHPVLLTCLLISPAVAAAALKEGAIKGLAAAVATSDIEDINS